MRYTHLKMGMKEGPSQTPRPRLLGRGVVYAEFLNKKPKRGGLVHR